MGTHPQDTRSPGDFVKRLQPRDPTVLWGARVGSAAGETPGSGDGGLSQPGTGRPGPGVLTAGTACPAPSAPGQSCRGTQACSGPRAVTPAQVPQARGAQRQGLFAFTFF